MGKLPCCASIWSFRRMRKEARWKRAPPNSWNRFRDFLLKIERIRSLFENDALALEARRTEPVGGGIDHPRAVVGGREEDFEPPRNAEWEGMDYRGNQGARGWHRYGESTIFAPRPHDL